MGNDNNIEKIKQYMPVPPTKVVVTSGMPYANGPLHIGHMAGTMIPADICARYWRMRIGTENVLLVCGSDDHGSTSELSALKAGKAIDEMVAHYNSEQRRVLDLYNIGLDIYAGTSQESVLEKHVANIESMLSSLQTNGFLTKKNTMQWYDPELKRFLQDRFVRGTCPRCADQQAYSNECEACGATFEANELIDARSELSASKPELRETEHLWLDMWKASDLLKDWVESKGSYWRKALYTELSNLLKPSLLVSNKYEAQYKEFKAELPPHKPKYAPGKMLLIQFESKADLAKAKEHFHAQGIATELANSWAHRPISRDVDWGIELPKDLIESTDGKKTLYVWPDSLIAPLAFTQLALKIRGSDDNEWKNYWMDPQAKVLQFLGQDNVFFYTVMQGTLWLGSQKGQGRLPEKGELQLTDVFPCYHLMVEGDKMSKSKGNFVTADSLVSERGYSADQVRYFLALLSLPEKASNFEFDTLNERNAFLAGPLNAAFEKPISACHSRFESRIPQGKLLDKVESESVKIFSRYCKSMERAEYSKLLFAIENYARLINSLFAQYKPHDDRFPEESRADALYSCFYVLKNIMIMLYPFVPETMDKLRQSLNLPESVFDVEELCVPIPVGHKIAEKGEYFPAVDMG